MKFPSLIVGLAGLAANVMAHPHGHEPSQALARRGVDLSKLRLPEFSSYVDMTAAQASTPAKFTGEKVDYVTVATDLAQKIVPGAKFRVIGDHYVGIGGMAHVNLKQTMHGLDIDNADFNINIDKDGNVFSYGQSFYTGPTPAVKPLVRRDFSDPLGAVKGVIETLGLNVSLSEATVVMASDPDVSNGFSVGSDVMSAPDEGTILHAVITGAKGTVKDPEARPVYIQKSIGELALVWRVETDVGNDWLVSYADSDNPKELLGVVSYSSDLASFEVYPWGVKDPSDGERVVVQDPWNLVASPTTWLGGQVQGMVYKTTYGNNIDALYAAPDSLSYRPNQPDLKFEYFYLPGWQNPIDYINAAITQVFYATNKYHDLLYILGFNEQAGNFQNHNFDKGGHGNDAVEVLVQEPGSGDNSRFIAPGDGIRPRMILTLYGQRPDLRDSSFDSLLVLHEYTHGVSTRLTGGPYNSHCLQSGESASMGEGWSDFMAVAAYLKPTDTRQTVHTFGAWIIGNPSGVRFVPYTTDKRKNYATYGICNEMPPQAIHDVGTVWATALYEVLWNLIDKHGINNSDTPQVDDKGVATDGRYFAMQLVLHAMALQPCRPNMVTGRDAILDADRHLTGGRNRCEIWIGFATRGLGVYAKAGINGGLRQEHFGFPADCHRA